jgi:hypothetical protein
MNWVSIGVPVSVAFVMRGSGVRFPEAAPPLKPSISGLCSSVQAFPRLLSITLRRIRGLGWASSRP